MSLDVTLLNAQFKAKPTLSPASPQLVATPVTVKFAYSGTVTGPVTYRFEVEQPLSTSYTIVKDYDQEPTFVWAQSYVEGVYSLRVTARDHATGNTAIAIIPYTINTRIVSGQPAVSATSHPLVALFSAPACPAGSSMKIGFSLLNQSYLSFTSPKPCGSGSMNFLIAGMQPQTVYAMNYYVITGTTTTPGLKALQFTTGAVAAGTNIGPVTLLVPLTPGATSTTEKYQLNSFQIGSVPYAFDLNGNIVWYWSQGGRGPEIQRLLSDGTYLGTFGIDGDWTGSGVWGDQTHSQMLVNFDMVGNVVQETNTDRINEQLPVGVTPITHFNHDSVRLPNGNTLAIADDQLLFPAGTQGSTAPIGIIGLMLLELDPNFQVIWHWDAFEHDNGTTGNLNINRTATLNDKCTPSAEGCPAVLLTNPSNDWLHANTLQFQQADGSLVVSLRDQDWIIDIDFGNGTGTQNVLWRMGLGGDFTIQSSLPYPWFSHQHDTEFHNGAYQVLTVLDNGNTRIAQTPGDSRGQVLNVSVTAKTVSLIDNQDLGGYSPGLGAAQILANGDYMYSLGEDESAIGGGTSVAQSSEYTPSGKTTFQSQVVTSCYRAFRIRDFYTPPNGAGVN